MTTPLSPTTGLEAALAHVISALAADDGSAQDAVNLFVANPLMQDALECLKQGDLDGFFIRVQYPNENLYRALVRHFVGDVHQIHFMVAEHQFVEAHFRYWIEAIEGRGCCADKSRTLMRALFSYFSTGKEIKWNYDQEYTFHLPKNVFITQAEVVGFFESLQRLRNGYPDLYLKELLWLSERKAQAATSLSFATLPKVGWSFKGCASPVIGAHPSPWNRSASYPDTRSGTEEP